MKAGKKYLSGSFLLICSSVFVILPLLLLFAASFMAEDELVYRYFSVLELGKAPVHPAILPGIFAAFPVFVMEKIFESIPKSFLETAYMDGGSEFTVFLRVGVPMGLPGIMTAMLLGFFEHWNALEAPLTFLKNKQLWPLSLYLPNVTADKASLAFVAGFVAMLPPVLLYLNGQTYLEQGISASGIKE